MVGTQAEALLADPDMGTTGIAWQWASGPAMTGPFTPIVGATSAIYNVGDTDSGKYLQATARYTDGHGPNKSASATAAVRKDVVGTYDTDRSGKIETPELLAPWTTTSTEISPLPSSLRSWTLTSADKRTNRRAPGLFPAPPIPTAEGQGLCERIVRR